MFLFRDGRKKKVIVFCVPVVFQKQKHEFEKGNDWEKNMIRVEQYSQFNIILFIFISIYVNVNLSR